VPHWKRLSALLALSFSLFAAACSGGAVQPATSGSTGAGTPAATSTPAPATSTPVAEHQGYLLVQDLTAEKLLVYALPKMDLAASFDRMKISAHAGALALPDGRVLFGNDITKELIALQLSPKAKPEIVGRAKMVTPLAWGNVDSDLKYFVASSFTPDTEIESATVVDLKTYQSASFQVDTKGNELHPFIVGDTLVAAIKGAINTYSVAEVMRGTAAPKVISTTPVDDGLHGPVQAKGSTRIHLTTLKGFDSFEVKGTAVTAAGRVPWDADGRTGGRNGRPRLSYDGNFVYGLAAATVKAEEWDKRENDLHIADLKSGTAKRLPFIKGNAPRFALSVPYAVFANIHPEGDFVHLVDVDPKSAKFQQVVGRVKLDPLANGPVAGKTAAGTESRAVAVTPDGKWAFASHGGDGLISVIDTKQQQVVQKLKVETPLKGGGYLIAVQPGAPLVDLGVR
jgi:hypothetical protein